VTVALWTVVPLMALHLLFWQRWRETLRFQLLLDVVVLAAVGPAILTGRDLNPVRALERRPPFQQHEWSSATDYQPTQVDLVLQFHPWWEAARDQLREGRLPVIAPGIGGGLPLLAHGQSGIWAPVMVPVWALGVERGTTVMAFWKLELAGLGTFLFLRRRLRLTWNAAALAGVAWGGTPYLVTWLLVPLAWVTAALPWAWWMALRAVGRRRGWTWVAGTAAGFGWMMGSGLHPETAAIVCGSALLAALAVAPRRWYRVAAVVAGSGGVALALAWPTVGAIASSSRSEITADRNLNLERPPWALQRELVAQALVPGIHGRPGRRWEQPYPHSPGAIGVGGAVLALALSGGWRRRHRWLARAGAACSALGLVLMIRIPPLDALLVRLPPIDHMTLVRWGVLVPWGLVVMAALAADGRRRSSPWVVGGVVVALTLASFVGPVVPWGWALLVVTAAAAAVTVVSRPALMVAAVVGELALLSVGVNPAADSADRRPTVPVVRFLQEHATSSDDRIIGLRRALPPNIAGRFGLADLRASDPLRPAPFARLMQVCGEPETILGGPLTELPSGLLGSWSVRWAVTPPRQSAGDGWLLRLDDPGGRVFENVAHLPPVRVVGRSVPEPADVGVLRATGSEMDFTKSALVRGQAEVAAELARLSVVRRRPDRIEGTTDCDGPCLVVVARPWAPGWNVTVDGRPAEIRITNVAGLGVVVPRGSHQVAFTYRPWAW
jgi:hypothetical protein